MGAGIIWGELEGRSKGSVVWCSVVVQQCSVVQCSAYYIVQHSVVVQCSVV